MHERGKQLVEYMNEAVKATQSSSAISCGITGGGVLNHRGMRAVSEKVVVGWNTEIGTLAYWH